jgi:hypothetical protein
MVIKDTTLMELCNQVTVQNNEQLLNKITAIINDLITSDFEKLISILYRLDISEAKLKYLLQLHTNENAGAIIAALIVERQWEKIKSRAQHKKENNDIAEADKW